MLAEETIRKDESDAAAGREAETRLPDTYYQLGPTYLNEARYDSAAFFFAKADSTKPNYADGLNMWGLALDKLALYDKALQKFRRAYTIDSTEHGPNHSEVASRLNNIAGVLESKGDYAVALAKFEEALAIFEKTYRRNHPNVATSLSSIAVVLHSKGDYDRRWPNSTKRWRLMNGILVATIPTWPFGKLHHNHFPPAIRLIC